MSGDKTDAPKRLHRATYARDKRNPGSYVIRVAGPTAAAFAGREVPVTISGGGEHVEKLTRCVWKGIEDSAQYGGKIGEPVALYAFESRPRDPEPEPDF